MKKQMKKLLCLVLVLMMAIPTIVLPVSAEDGDGLKRIDTDGFFTGANDKTNGWSEGWDGGLKRVVGDNGASLTISGLGQNKDANVSKAIPNLHLQGKSYTILFTLTAGDNNEEVGIMLDHQSGFVINPGENTFRYYRRDEGKTYVAETKYTGTGKLTQTYAIEIASTGSGTTNRNGDAQPNMTITHYKLYNVTTDDTGAAVWNPACDLSTAVSGGLSAISFDWGYAGNCDDNIYMRFWKSRKIDDAANSGSMTIKDFEVYEGLVAKDIVVETREYYKAADGDLLYTANFNSTDKLVVNNKGVAWSSAWGGMDVSTVYNNGRSIRLRPAKSNDAAAYRAAMDETNYPVAGNTYTMVFTATATDKDQEVGLYPDWSTGFVVIPGKNQFRYNVTTDDRAVNETVVNYTNYNGTGSLTQTYAVEFKVNTDFTAAEYSLYVAQDGEWVHLYSLNETQLAKTSWGGNPNDPDDETVIGFYRDSKIANQTSGTVTVSNVNVYKGFAAKSGKADVPSDDIFYNYDDAKYGDLIYVPDFNGDAVLRDPDDGWNGMDTGKFAISEDGNAVTLKAWKSEKGGAVWGADLKGYNILGNSYTSVFTVTAGDEDESIGFLIDDWAGFVVTPGSNSYKFISTKDVENNKGSDGRIETVIAEGTYGGKNGAYTQTYAVEIKTSGTKEEPKIDAYNLYVAKNGEWVLVCALTDAQRDNNYFDWFYYNKNEDGSVGDYEEDFTLRFYHNRMHDTNQNSNIKISNFELYKGLAATTGMAHVETKTLTYNNAGDGDLLFDVNFNDKGSVFAKDAKTGKYTLDVYDGLDEYVSDDGSYVTFGSCKPIPSVNGGVWGATVNTSKYPMPGGAYTLIFTVSAEDENQSIGIFPRWRYGVFLTPGQNKYSIGHAHDPATCSCKGTIEVGEATVVAADKYEGSGALTQTYALEIASGKSEQVNGEYTKHDCTKYNLYVLQDDVWVLVMSLDEAEREKIAWDTVDPELMIHLARYSSGEGNNEGKITVSDMKVYKGNNILTLELPDISLKKGASVRIDTDGDNENTNGIRFTGFIKKETYNAFKYNEDNSENTVKLGVIIVPTDYLLNNGIPFTKEALDACDSITGAKYLMIDGTPREYGEYWKINCAMVNLRDGENGGNLGRDFSARLYVEVNGVIVAYSEYNINNNSRSLASVAESAYNDVQSATDAFYPHETTLVGGGISYSPYEHRANLKAFFEKVNKSKYSSITVMSYNIRGGENSGESPRDITYTYQFIANSGVDVIGLQEDSKYEVKNIWGQVTATYDNHQGIIDASDGKYAIIKGNVNGKEENAILYDSSKFKVVNTGTVKFKELAESADVYKTVKDITAEGYEDTNRNQKQDDNEPTITKGVNFEWDSQDRFFRWAVLAELDENGNETGVKYLIVNTHLHFRKTSTNNDPTSDVSHPGNKALRQAQATLIRLWLENDEIAKQYSNSIVMGDMNCQENSNALGGIIKGVGGMNLASNDAISKGDLGGTLVGEDEEGTKYMVRDVWVYDHIAYNSEALEAAEFTVVHNKLEGKTWNYPSDHLPVAAKFNYYYE